MAVQRKVFRIEESGGGARDTVASDGVDSAERHREFMTALQSLRSLIVPAATVDRSALERARAQIAEAQTYKGELESIHAAITRTRDATGGGASAFAAEHTGRAVRELQAIVVATERATQAVLQAAEEIDQTVVALSGSLKSEYAKGLAQDVQERVVAIFEACNFQDLAGQRVGNVLAALKAVDDHVAQLQSIWQGVEAFKPVVFGEADERRYLNGPKLPEDRGHSTQDDIDGMFGCA
jgi:chemotaxis protein CheZ